MLVLVLVLVLVQSSPLAILLVVLVVLVVLHGAGAGGGAAAAAGTASAAAAACCCCRELAISGPFLVIRLYRARWFWWTRCKRRAYAEPTFETKRPNYELAGEGISAILLARSAQR